MDYYDILNKDNAFKATVTHFLKYIFTIPNLFRSKYNLFDNNQDFTEPLTFNVYNETFDKPN